jgi:hypothetical protein
LTSLEIYHPIDDIDEQPSSVLSDCFSFWLHCLQNEAKIFRFFNGHHRADRAAVKIELTLNLKTAKAHAQLKARLAELEVGQNEGD